MRPALARQFEHLPLLLDGQFGQAVHQSNTDHITLRSLALGARADRLALRAEDRGKAYDAEVSDVERCWSRLVDPVMPKSQRDWFGTWKSRIDEAKAEKSTEHVQALWSMLA